MKLVIKGAYYFNREADMIVVPLFTGEFDIVNCATHIRLEELEELYDKKHVDSVIEFPMEFKSNNYYKAECSRVIAVDSLELLSNLSELYYSKGERKF